MNNERDTKIIMRNPPVGSKFITISDDRSAAEICMRFPGGYVNSEGDNIDNINDCAAWIPLPDDFELFYEFTYDPFDRTIEENMAEMGKAAPKDVNKS